MPQPVSGYLSKDGNFFRTEPEARRHDSELTLRALCDSHQIPRPDALFEVIHVLANEIRDYINADEECTEPECKAFIPQNSLGALTLYELKREPRDDELTTDPAPTPPNPNTSHF